MNHTTMLRTLNNNATNIGLADWKIILTKDYKDLGDNYAEAEWEYWEKTMTITLSKAFKKKPQKFQKETLTHELIHARIVLAEEELEKITKSAKATIEEKLANDLTNMVEAGAQ